MVELLLKFWSLLFIVCRVLDIGCDFYYIYCSKDSNSVQDAILSLICMCGVMFNLFSLKRLLNAFCKIQPPDIGKINVSTVLLPELNFFVLEGVVNVLQAGIVSYSIATRDCWNFMDYGFTCSCCCGAIMQCVCFLKNLCGCHGDPSHYYCQDLKCINVFGLVLSLIYALIEVVSIANAQELQSCWHSWNMWTDYMNDGDLFSCYFSPW